jgi:ABC-type transport system substrate-binding protein
MAQEGRTPVTTFDRDSGDPNSPDRLPTAVSRRTLIRYAAGGTSLAAALAVLGPLHSQAAGTPESGTSQTNVTLTMPIVTTIDITLDPNKADNQGIFAELFMYIYGGMVIDDKDAHVQLDLAEKIDTSPDGLVYTFHVRPDAKFASGRPVVADDFVYSWKRALDPKTTSPAVLFLEQLKGADEYRKGTATEISGVRTIDDHTVELTLVAPYNYFLSYMCVFPWYIVDRQLVEKYGDSNNTEWTNHQPYGTGPWKVDKFDPTTAVELVPNEHHWNPPSPSITRIVLPILKGPTASNTALNLYKANQAQVVGNIPISLLDAVEKDYKDELVNVVAGGTDCIALSFTKKPFDNVLVRRAFAMAFDRETFCNQVWRGTRKPTDFFEPPFIKDYTSPPGIKYDPEEAKKVLAAAGFPNGQGLPTITLYMSSDNSAETINRWRAMAKMWNDTLGSNVVVDTSMTQDQIDSKRMAEKGFQLEDFGPINITETPQLMSEFWRSDGVYMKDRFDWGAPVPPMTYNGVTYDPTADSKQFDQLVAQADVEQDPTKRNALYHQCEDLGLRNAVYIPFGNYVFPALNKKNIQGLVWGAYYYIFPGAIGKDVTVV